MWHVIQTITGKERETIGAIERILKGSGYESCFFIQRECVWRIEGQYRIHIEPLFPSYIFVETETPEHFFLQLKRVPKLTKLLGGDNMFWTVEKEEEELLRTLINGDKDFVVRRSLVQVDERGDILCAKGTLEYYSARIVKKRLRKRCVTIELPFLGKNRRIQLGIWLEGDEEVEERK